ncbi:SDR family NAD(P)-dependent oxidoreductase [Cellulomonas fimi]|uniref:Short-chain dehydrogenase/reductase SDR n=1 Tax=Cellulomonas fimi (strain ATCC 484 / DSM 20113 / JCM 1341 / CCUG 24087 / LMG 16345 / NBRC 15513 / NCIMB 8980 / NCTC 7547 / NRS-133) TaxID=590998 RepID=F4H6W0_CELFA|nr:SDR family NAD(P)-dependent oxidoreductase [Cellulomonas fimi]AEE44469.1 short-chain dehydrogenase/reductase SDR [Cellulomonas fimi ATCC 484]NNH06632.1 SDR family NAD(P)-dependent oxidoreductase [Cellulomonas fimi]VEH26422.1 Ribitol 2-dehydrogenase [Cellulomonas fimi]
MSVTPDQPRPLAVVTGASSGIGLELASCFAAGGFDLLLTADDATVAVVADRLAGDVAVRHVQADLATADGVRTLVEEVRALGRPVDALALNAGTGQGGPFVETPLDGDLETVRLNVESTVRLAKALVPPMVERGAGRVLVTASTAALMPGPYYATYAASKSFVLSFAEALRHELKDTGVTVTALLPGPTDTEFFERADMEDTRVAHGKKDDPADVARQGFEALMAGKDKVVVRSAQPLSQAAAAKVLPDRAKAAMHATYTKPQDG